MQNEWETLNRLMETDPSARAAAMGLTVEDMHALTRLRLMEPWTAPRYANGDQGNGYLFADFYEGVIHYVQGRGCWYVYGDGVWREDREGLLVMERMHALAALLGTLLVEVTDPALREAASKRVGRLSFRGVREAALKDARAVHPLEMDDFNADPWLFNCQNGTLDLRNGIFRTHRAADLLTQMADVAYDPAATCPRWDAFVREIMAEPGEEQLSLMADAPDAAAEKAHYLQKMMGYALTGDTRYECFFLLYGPSTRNGKGTLMETILRMMGTYARTARPESLSERPANASGPTEDIARLHGARLVSLSEPERSMPLSASLVKRLTGNDTITARFLHEGSFEFRPQFKLFMNTNDLPRTNDPTLFTSGRVRVLPFKRHFQDHEQDKSLKAYLSRPEHLSAVLNWCVAGLRMLLEEGFEPPASASAAVGEYASDSDVLRQFMDECLVQDIGVKTKLKDVYLRYREWCAQNGYVADNSALFRRGMMTKAQLDRQRPTLGGGRTSILCDYRITGER